MESAFPMSLDSQTGGSEGPAPASGSQCFTTPHHTRRFFFSVTERVFPFRLVLKRPILAWTNLHIHAV